MKQYLDLLDHVLKNGNNKGDRTGTGTKSVFGWQMRFNLNDGLPLITNKKLYLKAIIDELLWFIKGDTNISYLKEHNVKIWNEWADEHGDLGPVYGKQWRRWESPDGRKLDQLENVIKQIKSNPDSRRMIVSAWNPSDVGSMALPPCHCLFQFYVSNNKLSCQLYQRSADIFLGIPFNIASYSILTHMIANVCELQIGDFIHTLGDAHIYQNHVSQANTQLLRNVKQLPNIQFRKKFETINDFKYEDFEINGYDPHPNISAPIAV